MHRLVEMIKQSPPVDVSAPYDVDGVAGKTIVITGGASGFGAAFARKWAAHGAHIMIGDINDKAGEEFVAELRTSTGSEHHHYKHCDVSDWQSQVSFFQAAARLSPTGGIDCVVANAGIGEIAGATTGWGLENPTGLDAESPPPPLLLTLDINLKGVLYTTTLAIYWLQRNGADEGAAGGATRLPSKGDRHLLLIGSVASMLPLVGQVQYTAAKHAVMGVFRSLRGSVWRQGIRVNLLCPYFVETNIMPAAGLLMMAGGGLGTVEDVVDAGTRLVADGAIVGRALVVGPRMHVVDGEDGESRLTGVPRKGDEGGQGIWECYAHDFDSVEVFVWKYTRLLNDIVRINGWTGWLKDVINILFFRKAGRK